MIRAIPKGFKVGESWLDRSGNECFYREDGSLRVITINTEPTMTIQSERDSCDLNKIVERFSSGQKSVQQIVSDLRVNRALDDSNQGVFGDFSNLVDFHDAVSRVNDAEDAFMALPAAIRTRFRNDPGELIDFLGKEENRLEAIELGLVNPPQATPMPQGGSTPPSDGGKETTSEGG